MQLTHLASPLNNFKQLNALVKMLHRIMWNSMQYSGRVFWVDGPVQEINLYKLKLMCESTGPAKMQIPAGSRAQHSPTHLSWDWNTESSNSDGDLSCHLWSCYCQVKAILARILKFVLSYEEASAVFSAYIVIYVSIGGLVEDEDMLFNLWVLESWFFL